MFTKKFIKIFHSVRDRVIFHFFRIWHSAKPRPMINVILQFLGLDLFNIKLSAQFYQNIPSGLRVNFHFFRIRTLAKPGPIPIVIWQSHGLHLVNIPMCMQNCITIFHSVQERAIFTFSEFEARQNLDRRKMTFHNLLGYILIISMFTRKSIKIFHSV